MIMDMCEMCANYCYDEYDDCYYCLVNLDQDEMERFLSCDNQNCPYFRNDDPYLLARKQ